jgi:hypothetical protein
MGIRECWNKKKQGTIFLEQTIRLPSLQNDLYMYSLYKSYGDNNQQHHNKRRRMIINHKREEAGTTTNQSHIMGSFKIRTRYIFFPWLLNAVLGLHPVS